MLTRVIGLALVSTAIYLAWVKLPSVYPLFFKATGMAVLARGDINKLAAAYCLTGGAGGFGLAMLVLGSGKRPKR